MKTLIMVLMALTLAACNKSDVGSACDTDDPLNDIPWLRELKEQFDKDMSPTRQRIVRYTYQGETVFLVNSCYLCADALEVVYDCEKNTICEFGGIMGKNTCPDFKENATGEMILYDQ